MVVEVEVGGCCGGCRVMKIERMRWERILREAIGYRSSYTISKNFENLRILCGFEEV